MPNSHLWQQLQHWYESILVKLQASLAWIQRPLVRTYQAVSFASTDILWQKMIDLTDVSWHPLITSTNAPNGLVAKPGLIYRAVTRLFPVPVAIFVERVSPQELLSVRIFPIPGLEERVTYRIESTVCGTQISYSVTLRGWLSPLAWSILKPYAARVAIALAQAAEQTMLQPLIGQPQQRPKPSQDLLGLVIGGLSLLATEKIVRG